MEKGETLTFLIEVCTYTKDSEQYHKLNITYVIHNNSRTPARAALLVYISYLRRELCRSK